MLDLVVISLAVAGLVSAVDEFIPPIRKYKALVALGAATGAYLGIDTFWVQLPVYGLASAFLALVMTLLVGKISDPEIGKLPKRVPRR